ncbi:transient receptor potential cation channel subfamily M member-like 2 [Ptychodera flava]|uniref:transient receptor potential cation channel subfamily M member-like 2 n=1 Tax=Ptychodera flava TaxID=63121 RepID=UPI00396AA9A2
MTDGTKSQQEENIAIPVVLVVVEGGCGTLETVYNYVSQNNTGDGVEGQARKCIPVVIVHGSGKAADIIAESLRLTEEVAFDDAVKELNGDIHLMLGNTESKSVEDCKSWLKEICGDRSRKLITVFNMDDAELKDIDRAILRGVLQAFPVSTQLDLAVELNRCDIAKEEILTVDNVSYWQTHIDSLNHILLSALIQNKADLAEVIVAYIVDMDRFLTYERLYALYSLPVYGDVGDADVRISTRHILREKFGVDKPKDAKLFERVSSLLKELTEDEYVELYQEKPRECEKVSDPDKHLFLWAVLLNRRSLAILFWKRLLTGNIGAALIAGRILRVLSGYAKRKEELTLHFDLLKHAE